MRFQLPRSKENIGTQLRRCGYAPDRRNGKTGEMRFSRSLLGRRYPRFHLYCRKYSCNLHLDQKQPSYKGTTAHSGEYEGKLVEAEVERIQNVMKRDSLS